MQQRLNLTRSIARLTQTSSGALHWAVGAVALAAASLSAAPAHAAPMQVSGRQLLDSCGQVFVVRGVEQILGEQLPVGNDWLGLVEEIAATGANAVRILPGVNTLTVSNVDAILTLIGQRGMIAFIDPLNGDNWLGRSDVKTMLNKHESYLVIDAYGEPQYDDRDRWRAEAAEALQAVRAMGYQVPLTVTANQFGRDLPSLFEHGADIMSADPLGNTFLGWQAYWGQGGYYQDTHGLSLTQAVAAIVSSGLPIQMGLDFITDLPSEAADYGTLMTEAQAHGIGWLWWDFYNPYGSENNLSRDGSSGSLTSTGSNVINTHAASIAKTAHLTCSEESGPFISINAGGATEGSFVADTGFVGGNLAPTVNASIDRSLVPAPQPPESVYQTERWGAMTYRIAGLAPNTDHDVDLHFAETVFSAAGQRRFHVNIGGKRKATNLDIFAAAGAKNRAIVKTYTGKTDPNGDLVIAFLVGRADQPKIDGIVIH
jgi:hypothetical protein